MSATAPVLPTRTDVLIVGGGNAALTAAISARRAGADVVICEAAPRHMRGGNTRHTRNLRAMHSGPLATLEGSYSEDEYFDDILRVTQGETNEPLTRMMIRESEGLVPWLEALGVRFQPALSGTLSLSRTNAFFLGGGKAMLNAEYLAAEALGVQIFYDADVERFELEEARFEAAHVRTPQGTFRLEAASAVIASGGFQANENWMREAWGSAADNFLIRGTPYAQGAPLRALLDGGANTVGDATQCHAVAIDARAPRYDGGIVSRLDCVCFSVVVNKRGERFYDEGEDFWPKRYAIWGRLVANQPEQIAYAIIDAKVANAFMPSVFPSIEADSLTELAALIDVPAAALDDTVTAFNAAIVPGTFDAGQLDDCHTRHLTPPKSHWAQPIDTPPYAAYPLRPGITFTYLGLEVDADARLSFGNRASPNLFAAGEVMAGNVLGRGYCAGTGMTIGAVFGRIAGAQAARVSGYDDATTAERK